MSCFAWFVPLLFVLHTLAGAAPVTDWTQVAREDIRFAEETIRTRHAGYIAGRLSVTEPLETGLRSALTDAGKVRSEQDYLRLMTRFIGGFGDPHTDIDLQLPPRAWTGIVLDRRDGNYRVAWSEPSWPTPLPPNGAQALTCDDVWIGTYLHTKVHPYNSESEEYPGSWNVAAQRLMFEIGLGWIPKQCVFALPDGSRKSYILTPRLVPDQLSPEYVKAVRMRVRPHARPVGLAQVAPDMQWVGMPDFDGAASGTAYEALYPKLGALPRSGWVIFDLRGNGGGNSTWGSRALGALYGNDFMVRIGKATGYVKYMTANQPTADLLRYFMTSPVHAASHASFDKNLGKVEAAMRAGQKMALVSDDETGAGTGTPALVRPHGPRLAAVIDRACFSSCQNFLMQLRKVDDTLVLGEASTGFSPFGEINRFDLPSGRGTLYIPSALYLTSQGTREPFIPDISYDGNMADDAELEKWVVRTLRGRQSITPRQAP